MKKMVATLFVCICFTSFAHAQLRTAIAGGIHTSSVVGNSSPQWDSLNYNYSSRTGFHVGIIAETHLFNSNNLYFQTGMSYTNKGRKFSSTFDSSGITKVTARQFVNYMEVPFNIVYKKDIGKKSRIIAAAGPYMSFLFSGRESKSIHYDNGSVDATENTSLKVPRSEGRYKNIDFGVNAIGGVEFGKLFVTANFSRGFGNFFTPRTSAGTFKHQVIGATVGFFLSNDKKRESTVKDRDNDGVPDDEDECPRLKGNAFSKGCPDEDNDGVADKDD